MRHETLAFSFQSIFLMRKFLSFYFCFIFLSVLFLSSCEEVPKETLSGTWHLIKYKNLIGGATGFEPKIGTDTAQIDRPIIITFSDDGFTGSFTAQTVHHELSGDYEIAEDDRLTIENFASTGVDYEYWGNKFHTGMQSLVRYERRRNKICLWFNNGRERMTLEAWEE